MLQQGNLDSAVEASSQVLAKAIQGETITGREAFQTAIVGDNHFFLHFGFKLFGNIFCGFHPFLSHLHQLLPADGSVMRLCLTLAREVIPVIRKDGIKSIKLFRN